jgi:hypothetical protein
LYLILIGGEWDEPTKQQPRIINSADLWKLGRPQIYINLCQVLIRKLMVPTPSNSAVPLIMPINPFGLVLDTRPNETLV